MPDIKDMKAQIETTSPKFRAALPEFLIKLLTDESDVVLDFFAGSNTAGFVAEALHRRWIALENVEDYLKASKFRFESLKAE